MTETKPKSITPPKDAGSLDSGLKEKPTTKMSELDRLMIRRDARRNRFGGRTRGNLSSSGIMLGAHNNQNHHPTREGYNLIGYNPQERHYHGTDYL